MSIERVRVVSPAELEMDAELLARFERAQAVLAYSPRRLAEQLVSTLEIRVRWRLQRQASRGVGICTQCHERPKAPTSRSRCEDCLASRRAAAELDKRTRDPRRCYHCKLPATPGRVLCEKHARMQREAYLRRKERLANGASNGR